MIILWVGFIYGFVIGLELQCGPVFKIMIFGVVKPTRTLYEHAQGEKKRSQIPNECSVIF